LRALKKTFFSEGDTSTPSVISSAERSIHQTFAPISAAEKWGAGLLMFATVAAGLYPKFLLDRILPAVEAMRFLKP
jgi:NADH:ubiquinone oxidoreductase subunit 4 (subunit M)